MEIETKELVSVVVPVYNVEEYINHCVKTIINQTYGYLDIILIDDGSTDDSGVMCDNLALSDSRVRVIHQNNMGLSGARNSGIDVAKGKYICFIDSDDYVSPLFVESMMMAMQQADCDMVISRFEKGSSLDFLFPCVKAPISCKYYSKEELLSKWHGKYKDIETMAWNKLYKMSLFNTDIRYPLGHYFEDVPTTHKIVNETEKVAIIDNILYYYYQRNGSIKGASSDEKIVHNIESQEWRLIWFKESGFRDAYQRMFSKYLKYLMVSFIKANSDELELELIQKFRLSLYEPKVRFSLCDRIMFFLWNHFYKVIKPLLKNLFLR